MTRAELQKAILKLDVTFDLKVLSKLKYTTLLYIYEDLKGFEK